MTLLTNNRPLLDAFRRGENDALASVYREYADDVLQLLFRGIVEKQKGTYIRGIADVNQRLDCLQDVFVKAFAANARESYDGLRPYRSYLLTIARNRLIDYWRAHSRDPVAGDHTVVEEDPEAFERIMGAQQTETAAAEESRLHWQRCLAASDSYFSALDKKTQRFVALRFREELPLLEVARQLHMSRWKARSLEKKLQLNLHRYLQREGLLK